MDGQNFQNEQNNNYQDNTANIPVSSMNNGQPEQPNQNNGLAIASLVMGILSIVFACCYGIGIIFAIIGIVCAVVAMKKGKSGMLTAGLICSIVGAVFSVIAIIYFVVVISAAMSDPDIWDLFEYYYNY